MTGLTYVNPDCTLTWSDCVNIGMRISYTAKQATYPKVGQHRKVLECRDNFLREEP